MNRKENIINTSGYIIWILVASFVVMMSGDIVGMIVFPELPKDYSFGFTLMSYMSFMTMWVAVIFAVVVFKKNHYIIKAIVKNESGNNATYLAIGFGIGFLLNVACAVIAVLHGDFSLEFVKFNFFPVIMLFIAVFIQSSAEEVLCRGFMYQKILKKTQKPWLGIMVNSIFFAMLHLFNDGMSLLGFYDMVITAVFFSLIVYYFDSLWMAMGVHTTWNFTQSILLGLPNSGESFPYSIFALDGSSVNGSFAYDVTFGLEGTPLSAIIMTICCLVLIVGNRVKTVKLIRKKS